MCSCCYMFELWCFCLWCVCVVLVDCLRCCGACVKRWGGYWSCVWISYVGDVAVHRVALGFAICFWIVGWTKQFRRWYVLFWSTDNMVCIIGCMGFFSFVWEFGIFLLIIFEDFGVLIFGGLSCILCFRLGLDMDWSGFVFWIFGGSVWCGRSVMT